MKSITKPLFSRPVISMLAAFAAFTAMPASADPIPKVGDDLPGFTLKTLDSQPVDFAKVAKGRTTVLVVLRGWPGYQCPFCTTQVYEYVAHAADFSARDIAVIMVYPGPAEQMLAHAKEFLADKKWPKGFLFVLDPDYAFTNRYSLRWNEKNETAYPSTFVVDTQGKIRFARVSHEHGDRLGAAELLRLLDGAK